MYPQHHRLYGREVVELLVNDVLERIWLEVTAVAI